MSDTTTANKDVAVIDQQKDLAHLSELEVEITGYKEKFKVLKIDGPEDKDGYEEVRKAIGVLRPKRTGLEAERKSVVKPYNDFVKHINSQYDAITTLIQEGPGGELELKEKKEVVDGIIKQQEEEEERQKEQKINNRINELIAKGMVFDGNYYVIGDKDLEIPETSIGVVDIRTMSDDLYNNFLQMVEDKSKKITAEKERLAELERVRLEEENKQKLKEQEEFKKQQALLLEQQAEMKRQQDELILQQQQLDKARQDAELREQQAEQNRINGIIRNRSAVLTGMGLEYNSNGDTFDYSGEVLVVDAPGIADYNDEQWIKFTETVGATIKQKKADAEKFLADQQQKEKERLDLLEKERQAGLKDKDRMKEYTAALLAVPVPDFNTKTWKTKAAGIRDFITDNRPA